MIWAILAFLGVPLWLCALAILAIVLRNRALRTRPGNIPVRVQRPGRSRWTRGHAVWVSDVFAWRGSPAMWKEELNQVHSVYLHVLEPAQRKKLRRLGPDPAVAVLSLGGGESLSVAAANEHSVKLLGPFAGRAGEAEQSPIGSHRT